MAQHISRSSGASDHVHPSAWPRQPPVDLLSLVGCRTALAGPHVQGLLRLQDRWPRSSLFARMLTSRRPAAQPERLIAAAWPPTMPAARPPANACYFASTNAGRSRPTTPAAQRLPQARCLASPLNRHTLAPHRTPPQLPLPMNAIINISSTPISHSIIPDEYCLRLPASPSLYPEGPKVGFLFFFPFLNWLALHCCFGLDLPTVVAPNSWSPYRGRGRLPDQSKT